MRKKSKEEAVLDEFVLLDKFSDPAEAYIIKGMLATNGIPSIIEGDVLSSVYPATMEFSMIRLLVRRRDLLMATQLTTPNA